MRKLNFLFLPTAVICGMLLVSCTERYDNPVYQGDIGGDDGMENIVEKSYFADFIDLSVYAGDNFYQYATNGWIKSNPIPAGSAKTSVQGQQGENATKALKQIISGQVGNEPVINQLKASYNHFDFDSDKKVINEKFSQIDAIKDYEGAYKMMAQLMKEGYPAPFYLTVRNVEREVKISLLPAESSDYMSLTSSQLTEYTGMGKAEANAIIKAGNEWKEFLIKEKFIREKKDNRPKILKRLDVVKTRSGFSNIFKELGITDELWGEEIIEDLSSAIESVSIKKLKNLLKYFIANRDVYFIVADSDDDIDGTILGLFQTPYCVTHTLVSRVYSETQIKPEIRQHCQEMCEDYRSIFRERIQQLPWMSDATKQKAIEKLDGMMFFVGWPAQQHSEWEVQPVTAPTGYQAVLKLFEQSYPLICKLAGQKSNDALFYADWFNSPSFEANAFYQIQNNSMCILSSNLVPPIYDTSLGDAFVHASLGFTIGHEITHGFDSKGSQYNKYGAEENWWASNDSKIFLGLQEKMINHFSNMEYYPGYYCDGKETLAENIADLGGLNISYQAYMKQLEKKGASQKERDYQAREFFRGYAYSWAENFNKKGADGYADDTHSAPNLRVNGNIYQLDEFYRVFNMEGGESYIFPQNRISIW